MLMSHNGGTMGKGRCVQPKAHSANMAANLRDARALQLCPSYHACPSPQGAKLKMGETNPSLGEGGHRVRHESKQAR